MNPYAYLTPAQIACLDEIGKVMQPFADHDGRVTVVVDFTCRCGERGCNGVTRAGYTFERSVKTS